MVKQIKLPKVLVDLLKAQENFNSSAFAENFAENAKVFDEGKEWVGKKEIKKWNEFTNRKYHTKMQPAAFKKVGKESILTILMSGTFPGSPLPAEFHFIIDGDKIVSLKIN